MKNYPFVVLAISPADCAGRVKRKGKDKVNFKQNWKGENMVCERCIYREERKGGIIYCQRVHGQFDPKKCLSPCATIGKREFRKVN